MASSTSRYVFDDEEVSQLASCTDLFLCCVLLFSILLNFFWRIDEVGGGERSGLPPNSSILIIELLIKREPHLSYIMQLLTQRSKAPKHSRQFSRTRTRRRG